MLQHTTDFPQAGSIGYLRHTATKARIIRHNADDGTMLVQVFDPRGLHGKASGNRTVEPSEIFADPETASFGSIRAAKRAQRARAAGGRGLA